MNIINPLISNGIIKFYCRNVDDTLLLIKHDDIKYLLDKFHSFDSNIRFTNDKFSNEPPHFLDLHLDGNEFSIYRKPTFIGQYTAFIVIAFTAFIYILTASYHGNIALLSFALFSVGYTGSVHLLNSSRNCNLLRELHHAWNGFPKQVVSSLMKRFGKPTKDPTGNNNLTETNVSEPTLWFEMPYIGQKGEQLLRGL